MFIEDGCCQFDLVPIQQRGEFVTWVLTNRPDADDLLRDWQTLGIVAESAITGSSLLAIVRDYPAVALERLTQLAEDALLARLPPWRD